MMSLESCCRKRFRKLATDWCSRAPVVPPSPEDDDKKFDILPCKVWDVLAPCQDLAKAAQNDKSYQQLISLILTGCQPSKIPLEFTPFKAVWNRLSVLGGH